MLLGFYVRKMQHHVRSLDALRIFKSVPEFFSDENLRKAASIYIERNNNSISKAGVAIPLWGGT